MSKTARDDDEDAAAHPAKRARVEAEADGAEERVAKAPLDQDAEPMGGAEKGDAEALYKLGDGYKRGKGVELDLFEALRLFERAAEQGHEYARYEIGCGEAASLATVKAVRLAELALGAARANMATEMWRLFLANDEERKGVVPPSIITIVGVEPVLHTCGDVEGGRLFVSLAGGMFRLRFQSDRCDSSDFSVRLSRPVLQQRKNEAAAVERVLRSAGTVDRDSANLIQQFMGNFEGEEDALFLSHVGIEIGELESIMFDWVREVDPWDYLFGTQLTPTDWCNGY